MNTNTTAQQTIFQQTYLLRSILKQDPKGDVYKCFYYKNLFQMGYRVLKQGRKGMWLDVQGRDMTDRLDWQRLVHRKLSAVINIPLVLDHFEENGHSYLVMEFIKGKTLRQLIKTIYQERTWPQLRISNKRKLLGLLMEVMDMVARIHRMGYVHRDLSPENFMVAAKDRIYLLDMELAYAVNLQYPLPPFQLGSPGYMSVEQIKVQVPTYKEDVFALGALMVVFFTNVQTTTFEAQNTDWVTASIATVPAELQLTGLIKKCMDQLPELRPEVSEIQSRISSVLEQLRPAQILTALES